MSTEIQRERFVVPFPEASQLNSVAEFSQTIELDGDLF